MITISEGRYDGLIRKELRLELVANELQNLKYPTTDEINRILAIAGVNLLEVDLDD